MKCQKQGQFVIRGLALATIYLPTEFEISISTHYEDKGEGDCPGPTWGKSIIQSQ